MSETEILQFALLGGAHITRNEVPVTNFVSGKAQALLFYLAVTGRTHTRQALAGLLWGDMPESDAKTNLRKALSNLRQLVGPYLLITRHTVAFDQNSAYHLDVALFEQYIKQARAQSGRTLNDEQVTLLSQAVTLYPGDFLAGFHVKDAISFEEWALGLRERLHELALNALHDLAVHHTIRQEYAVGIEYTTRLLTLDPWREEAHRQLMLLLARSGRRRAALAQYDTCRQILAEELDVEPLPETTELYERIQAIGASRRHNLPPQPTPLIGRQTELAEAVRLLSQPDCRLLTIVGPGGIGKTRLALQLAAERMDSFLQGVCFVPLVSLDSVDFLAQTIADALSLSFQGQEDPKTQLLNYLRPKELLLLLDDFEHLLASVEDTKSGITLLTDVLQAAPEVKILVTSRQRLNLSWEWLFELKGLDLPDEAETTNNIEACSAVQLFLQRARRVHPHFSLLDQERVWVARICRLLEGLPLGIELAAAWTRTLSCAEIADEIQRNPDFLAASLQDIPARHKNLRTVFTHSWNLLPDEEKDVFKRLSVFGGGFERDAARQVAGASAQLLSSLEKKSLLRQSRDRRYEMHQLLRQFATEKLAEQPAENEKVRERHSQYYLERLRQYKPDLRHPKSETVAEIRKELGNLQVGWRWAIAYNKVAEIEAYAAGLGLFFERQNRFQEMIDLFEQALAWERKSGPDSQTPIEGKDRDRTKFPYINTQTQLRRARWERQLGMAYFKVGRLSASREHHLQSLSLLGRPFPGRKSIRVASMAYQILCQVLHRLWPTRFLNRRLDEAFNLLEAVRAYEQLGQIYFFANKSMPALYSAICGLNLAETTEPSPELARFYASLGLTTAFVPVHLLAGMYNRLAIKTARQIDHLPALAWVLELNSLYHSGLGQWEKARQAALQGAEIASQLGDLRRWEECMVMPAHAAHYQGQFAAGIEGWCRIYDSAIQRGDAQVQVWGLSGQAENLLCLGRTEEVIALLEKALALPVKNTDLGSDISCHGVLSVANLRLGKLEAALQAAEKTADFIAQSLPTAFSSFEGYAGLAETYLHLWEVILAADSTSGPIVDRYTRLSSTLLLDISAKELKAKSKQANRALRTFARIFPFAQPRAWVWQGVYKWLSGRHRSAHKTWQMCLSAAQRLDMPYEQGLAHYEIGRHLAVDSPTRQEHLAQACKLFSQLGDDYHLACARSALNENR